MLWIQPPDPVSDAPIPPPVVEDKEDEAEDPFDSILRTQHNFSHSKSSGVMVNPLLEAFGTNHQKSSAKGRSSCPGVDSER